MSRDDATLLDVRHAAQRIVEFGDGMSAADFGDDPKTLSAVLYQIAVLGEAVKRLSSVFRAAHPEIPWKDAAGMRDHVTHGYDKVDLDIVAETVKRTVPALLKQLEPLIK